MLHIAGKNGLDKGFFSDLMISELEQLGDLSILPYIECENERADRIRECDILITCWESAPVPKCIAAERGSLKYICNMNGEMKRWIPLCVVEAGIPVTYHGDAPAKVVAEGAMALLLSVLKDIRPLGKHAEAGLWATRDHLAMGTLNGLKVGIYGMGEIARKFVGMIEPFEPELTGYDPFVENADWLENVRRMDDLDGLVDGIEALVIHAGLTPETRHSINAVRLAKLPDNGIIINTARGGIIDQGALFAELHAGRLRAGLDVLDGDDRLPMNDPARFYPNLILSCHQIAKIGWPVRGVRLSNAQKITLENIGRFINGEPLKFIMDKVRYLRST